MAVIKIGVSYEGKRDIEPIKIILEKIFSEFDHTPEIIHNIPARTGIVGFVMSHTKRLFKFGNPVQAAVYLTDKDKQDQSLEARINKEIKKVDYSLPERCAIGVPDPHFEEWLMADKGNISAVFNISIAEIKLLPKYQPKQMLEHLQRNMKKPVKTLKDCYKELAEMINIPSLIQSHSDFKKFHKNVERMIVSLNKKHS